MPVREIKTTIALDGEQQFKKALADASREMRVMDSELKAVTAAYRANGDGAEYFASKQRNLKSQISQQEAIIKGLEQAVEDAGKAYGESSSQVDGYTIKLNNARAKMSQLEKQLSETDREVEELGRDSVKAGRQIEDGIGESAQEAEKDVKSLVSTLQDDLSAIRANTTFTAIGSLWDMAKGAYSAAYGFVEQTAEYRRQLSFLELNAQNQGFDFDWIKKQLYEVQALIGDSSTAVEGLSNLMNTPGMEENKLALAVELLGGAVAAFPETLKFESLAGSLQETIATGEAAGPFAELLNRLGIDTEEFNDALSKSPTATGDLDTALAYLASHGMKDMYNKWRQNNQAMQENRKLNAELESELGKLGGKIEEYITTPFTGLKLAATQKVLEVIEYVESELDKYAESKGYTQDKTGRSEPGIGVNVEYTPDPRANQTEKKREQHSIFQKFAEKYAEYQENEYLQELDDQTIDSPYWVRRLLNNADYAIGNAGAMAAKYLPHAAMMAKQTEEKNWTEKALDVLSAPVKQIMDWIFQTAGAEEAKKAGADTANAYLDGFSDQIIVDEAEAKEILKIPTIAPVQTQEEIEKAEQAGAVVADAYFDGLSDQITANNDEAIQAQSFVNMSGMPTEGDLEEIIKGIDEKLKNAQKDLEEAGEDAGDAMAGGFETAWTVLENKAYMAGVSTGSAFADGLSSQLGAITAAAARLTAVASAGISRAAGIARMGITLNLDGRKVAEGLAPYTDEALETYVNID